MVFTARNIIIFIFFTLNYPGFSSSNFISESSLKSYYIKKDLFPPVIESKMVHLKIFDLNKQGQKSFLLCEKKVLIGFYDLTQSENYDIRHWLENINLYNICRFGPNDDKIDIKFWGLIYKNDRDIFQGNVESSGIGDYLFYNVALISNYSSGNSIFSNPIQNINEPIFIEDTLYNKNWFENGKVINAYFIEILIK